MTAQTEPTNAHELRSSGRGVRTQMLAMLLPAIVIVFAASMAVAVLMSSSAQRSMAYQQATELARHEADSFDVQSRAHQQLAQALSRVMESYSGGSRDEVSAMLQHVLDEDTSIVGAYVAYEPNAFDGKDADYVGAAGHDDTGRFLPYWNRLSGTVAVEPLVGYDTDAYYQAPKASGTDSVIEPYLYQGTLMASYVSPITRDGQFVGISGVDVSLGDLDKTVSAITFLDSGYAFLVSNGGLFVSYPDKDYIGTKSMLQLAKDAGNDDLAQVAKDVQAGREGQIATIDPTTGKQVILFYAPVGTGNWSMVVVAPVSEMLAAVNRMRDILVALAVGAALALSALVWVVAGRVASPVRTLTTAAIDLAEGGFLESVDAKTRQRLSSRTDELGTLGRAFEQMVESFRGMAAAASRVASGDLTVEVSARGERDVLGQALAEMVGSLRATVQSVMAGANSAAGAAAQSADASNQAGQATNQVAVTTEHVAKGASQAAETVADANRSMEELTRAIDGIAKGAQEAANAVGAMATSAADVVQGAGQVERGAGAALADAETGRQVAGQGTAAVSATLRSMDEIRTVVLEATTKVQEMGQRSQEVSRIVGTIEDIAAQTNLLALNAQIEAARAGEQGRGFAVVADEVRKLAERSARATKEIADLVEAVQSGANEAVSAIARGGQEVGDGVELAKKSGAVIEQLQEMVQRIAVQVGSVAASGTSLLAASQRMVGEVERVSAVVEEVSASTEEMAASSTQVANSLSSVAAIAQEVGASAEEVASSTEEVSAQAQEVTALAQAVAEQAAKVLDAVSFFDLGQHADAPQAAQRTEPDARIAPVRGRPSLTRGGSGGSDRNN
jgi:methyl-accepting chemotaxis protein